jgi:hypothetical protein
MENIAAIRYIYTIGPKVTYFFKIVWFASLGGMRNGPLPKL